LQLWRLKKSRGLRRVVRGGHGLPDYWSSLNRFSLSRPYLNRPNLNRRFRRWLGFSLRCRHGFERDLFDLRWSDGCGWLRQTGV
jgi:hypothetical protein